MLVNAGNENTVLATLQLKPIGIDSVTGILTCVLLVHAAEKITIKDATKWALRAVELYAAETGDPMPMVIARIELDYPTYRNEPYAPWRGEGK